MWGAGGPCLTTVSRHSVTVGTVVVFAVARVTVYNVRIDKDRGGAITWNATDIKIWKEVAIFPYLVLLWAIDYTVYLIRDCGWTIFLAMYTCKSSSCSCDVQYVIVQVIEDWRSAKAKILIPLTMIEIQWDTRGCFVDHKRRYLARRFDAVHVCHHQLANCNGSKLDSYWNRRTRGGFGVKGVMSTVKRYHIISVTRVKIGLPGHMVEVLEG